MICGYHYCCTAAAAVLSCHGYQLPGLSRAKLCLHLPNDCLWSRSQKLVIPAMSGMPQGKIASQGDIIIYAQRGVRPDRFHVAGMLKRG